MMATLETLRLEQLPTEYTVEVKTITDGSRYIMRSYEKLNVGDLVVRLVPPNKVRLMRSQLVERAWGVVTRTKAE
jgi:hypothetical protein